MPFLKFDEIFGVLDHDDPPSSSAGGDEPDATNAALLCEDPEITHLHNTLLSDVIFGIPASLTVIFRLYWTRFDETRSHVRPLFASFIF